jgi:hypothetical protein
MERLDGNVHGLGNGGLQPALGRAETVISGEISFFFCLRAVLEGSKQEEKRSQYQYHLFHDILLMAKVLLSKVFQVKLRKPFIFEAFQYLFCSPPKFD